MTEKIHDGSIYHGEMLGFLRHGQGRMTYSNGKYYEGQWELGEITGYGTLFSKDNSVIYQGTWKNGKYHGQGTLFNYRQLKIEMKFKERPIIYEKQVGAWVKFKGEFKEDRWDGYGGLLFTNGDNYKGEFKNDKIHGNGFYEAKSGRVWKGIWEDNSFII